MENGTTAFCRLAEHLRAPLQHLNQSEQLKKVSQAASIDLTALKSEIVDLNKLNKEWQDMVVDPQFAASLQAWMTSKQFVDPLLLEEKLQDAMGKMGFLVGPRSQDPRTELRSFVEKMTGALGDPNARTRATRRQECATGKYPINRLERIVYLTPV